MAGAVHGHLPLLHRLEQRRLGFRRRSIDLVGEQHLGEDRSPAELEGLRLRVVDAHPGHIAGEQVRGELHPLEAAPAAAGERFGQQRLAGAGNVLDQKVAAAQKPHDAEFDLRFLPDDDRPEALLQTPCHCLDIDVHGDPRAFSTGLVSQLTLPGVYGRRLQFQHHPTG